MNFNAVAQRLPEVPLMIVMGERDPICPAETMVDPFLTALAARGFSVPVTHRQYFRAIPLWVRACRWLGMLPRLFGKLLRGSAVHLKL